MDDLLIVTIAQRKVGVNPIKWAAAVNMLQDCGVKLTEVQLGFGTAVAFCSCNQDRFSDARLPVLALLCGGK